MLDIKALMVLSKELGYQFQELEKMLIWDIARRIKSETNGEGEYTQTAEKQMQDLIDYGYDSKKAREMIANTLGTSASVIDSLVYQYAMETYSDDHSHYLEIGKNLMPFERNGFIQNLIRATQDELKNKTLNLSGTTGFVDSNGKFHLVDDYYKNTLNTAVFQVASGSFDYQSVMRRMVKELGNSGVRTVNYDSGVSKSLESTVRNNILTGLSQLTGTISLQNAIEMGEDLMEITAHAGARPSHAEWQGQLVSLSGRTGYLSTTDIGYGDVAGFKGANCYHDWYPFFEGISERKYTQEQLDEFNDDSPKYEYNGKWYNEYEAGQKMRQIERSIAHTKRELVGYDAIDDKDMFTARSIYLRRQRELYDEFSKVSGQQKMPMNHLVYNFDRKKATQATWAYKTLDNASNKLYNSKKIGEYYADYFRSVNSGKISSFVRAIDYFKYKSRIDTEIVGIKTSTGIEIKGQTKHFIERIFGTGKDPDTKKPRNGVELEHVSDALLNPLKVGPVKYNSEGKPSILFIGEKASVSVNPDTGNLVQCNPTKKKLADKLKKGDSKNGNT